MDAFVTVRIQGAIRPQEGVGHQFSQIVSLLHPGYGEIQMEAGAGQHPVIGQVIALQIGVSHHVLPLLHEPGDLRVLRHRFVNGNQPVIHQLLAAVTAAAEGQAAQIGAVGAAGDNVGIVYHQRLRQGGVGVAGDNDVNAVHRFGQFLILGDCQRLPGAAVGQAQDNLRPFRLQLLYAALRRLRRIRPGEAGGGGAFVGVHPHEAEQPVGDAAPLQRHAVGDAVIVHGRLDEIPVRVICCRGIVGFQQGGEGHGDGAVLLLIGGKFLGIGLGGIRRQADSCCLSRFGGVQHFPEAHALVVKLVVADGHGVIAQRPHGAQFRRLGGVQGLNQGADGKVAAVHQQSVGMGGLFPVNDGFQPGVAAAFASLCRGLGQEVGVKVVGKKDGGFLRRRLCRCRKGTQHRQQQCQSKCGKTADFHGVPPSYSKRESGKDSLFHFSVSHLTALIIPAPAGSVNESAYRSNAMRSSSVSRRTAS